MSENVLSSGWRFSIPMPLQIVVDDVGWWSGSDDSEKGGPGRTGIARDHVLADYEALAALGRELGMRPQAAFVISEWDRENILRGIPTSTWMGEEWNNARWVGPWLDEAAEILRRNRDHIEMTVHGVGHEYWEDGGFTYSEFHLKGGFMRPKSEVIRHLEAFGEILEQNGLGPFPESFVPPSFIHSFGNGSEGIQEILKDFGIKFVSTTFHNLRRLGPAQNKRIAVECGVMLVDRGSVGIPWYEIESELRPVSGQPIYGVHWPNFLHTEPERNLEVVGRWVDGLLPYDHRLDTMLAPDTATCWTQFAHEALATMRPIEGGVEIDLARLRSMPESPIGHTFTVKVEAPRDVTWFVGGGTVASDPTPLEVPGGTGNDASTPKRGENLSEAHETAAEWDAVGGNHVIEIEAVGQRVVVRGRRGH